MPSEKIGELEHQHTDKCGAQRCTRLTLHGDGRPHQCLAWIHPGEDCPFVHVDANGVRT